MDTVTENKDNSVVESLLNSNEKFSKEFVEKLVSDKEECQKFINDLKVFKSNHKPNDLIFSDPDDLVAINEKDYETVKVTASSIITALNEFRIQSRLAVLSEKKRLLYIIREEELLTTINKLQDRIAEFDKFVEENGEESAMREYSNAQLNDLTMIRSQSIPMYLVELETLSSAVADNENNFATSTEKSFSFASGIIKFLESEINGSEG